MNIPIPPEYLPPPKPKPIQCRVVAFVNDEWQECFMDQMQTMAFEQFLTLFKLPDGTFSIRHKPLTKPL